MQNREDGEKSKQITTKGTSVLKQCNELREQSIEHVL
jgi:predicted transcriptional regulator